MLARVLLLILVVELAAYAWLWRSASAAGWHPAVIVAVIVAAAALLRAGVTIPGFAIAWRHGGRPAVGLGMLGRTRLVAREALAMIRNYLLVPFEPWMRAEPSLSGEAAPRVVLVHGILCNRAAWWRFRRVLERRGHATHAVTVEPVLGDLDSMTDDLARSLRAVHRPIVLVGHSMGGLLSRRLVRRYPEIPVLGIVTLGTPHAGSRQARFAFGEAGRSLRCDSPFMRRLAEVPPPARLQRAAIYSWHDELVSPANSCAWAGARDVAVAGIGHVDLLWDDTVAGRVADLLDEWLR